MSEREKLRLLVARRAAELMYFDGVKEYLRAKRKAARELGLTVFPNNVQIRREVDSLADRHEGPLRGERLLQLRRTALEVMEKLEGFSPRLIGSVLSGEIRRSSDIDLHAFAESWPRVGERLAACGYDVTYDVVRTRKGGEDRDFPHFYLESAGATVEISVYPLQDLKRPQKSSITHRTMDRATTSRVRKMLAEMEKASG